MNSDYGVIPNIDDPKFDSYHEIFDRLDKVRLIADVIFTQYDGHYKLSEGGIFGAYTVLDESVKDLRTICTKLCGFEVPNENH